MEELRRNKKCRDFICVLYGFGYTGEKMEPYTRNRMKILHEKIYRKLAGLPRCQQQCSTILNRWCETCSKWKKELIRERRGKIEWEKTESWRWPESYENIVDVFLPTDWSRHDITRFSDVSTQCHIWYMCKAFNLNQTFVKNVRDARNATYHNSSCQVTDVDKAKAFDALKDIIKDPDTAADIDVKSCLKGLNDIEMDNDLHSYLNESQVDLILKRLAGITEGSQSTTENSLTDIHDRLADIRDEHRIKDRTFGYVIGKLETIDRSLKTVVKHQTAAILLAFLFLVWTNTPKRVPFLGKHVANEEGNYSDQAECVSESYTYPFVQDLPLLDYVRDHRKLIGRKWLFEIFERKILQDEASSHGIVSIADFGYGKSAIISHLLCARPGEKGRFLREYVTAFHICKYDVASTQSPERFIRRLVGFFASKIPEYGSIISLLSNTSVLYDSEKCAKELEACFDQAFRIPFKKINPDYSISIIVIDALDECFHSSKNRNFILDLLSTRIQYFPKWIKFLITTRDMLQLQSLRKLERLHLFANDSNNLKDVNDYIEIIYKGSPNSAYTKNRKVMKKLLKNSEGSFLYIIHALQYIESPEFNGTLPKLPLSLEDIYELNFDRQFQGGKTFGIAKIILEVICASLTPLNKIDIYNILKNSQSINTTRTEFERQFEKLVFFVKAEDGVVLRHKAIHNWLVASSTDRYKVSLTEGHALISKHLLTTAEQNGTGDILALVIHLSNSKDQSLRKIFLSFNMKKVVSFEEKHILHNLIGMTKSEDALDLLLSHHSDLNIVDTNGVSPAFLAAAKGHLGQLKLLIRKGADLNFIVHPCRRCDTQFRDIKNAIKEIKTTFYSGYGLLHIAVQHKFTEVVEYLIKETRISSDIENVIGQRPSDMACEMGDIVVVKMFISYRSDVIDDKCLYFATRNGHFNIVKYILDSGFRPSCVANRTAMNELDRIMQSCNCEKKGTGISNPIRPLDTWWIVLQETPLHYALRSGQSKIAKYVTEKTKRLNRCVDAYGYTPFLLGIKYNRYKHTNMSRDRASMDECYPSQSFLTRESVAGYGTVVYEKGEAICPEGATFAHIMAIYDRIKMLDIFENNSSLKWNILDKLGNKPIHYAARHGSTGFIRFMSSKFGRNAFEERSSNGSTAYHAAAISCSQLGLEALTNYFRDNMTDFKDNYNSSLIQYALMCERNRFADDSQYTLTFQTQKYLFSLTNISHVDNSGRNILHYILRFGHKEMLHYLHSKYTFQFNRMLNTGDKCGLTPVEQTIHSAPPVNMIYSSAAKELFNKDSLNAEKEQVKRLLYPWEICLIKILKYSLQEDVKNFFMRFFDLVIVKSPFLTKAVLSTSLFTNSTYLKTSNVKELVVKGIKTARCSNRERILPLSVQAIAYAMPNILHECGKSLNHSPLHYMAMTFPWTSDMDINQIELFENIFKKVKNKKLLHCSTITGLNLLHYSILGGYITLSDFLIKRKLPIITNNVSVTDILHMAVFARYNENAAYGNFNQYSSVDMFLSKFIKDRKSELKASDFCSNSSKNLSLVHIFAINGMDRTIKTVADLYGIENTYCINVHNFTPLYFAHLFGRRSVIEFLESSSNFILPDVNAADVLFNNIINNFPQTRRQNPFRCLTSRRMVAIHTRTLIQNYRCLKTFYEIQFVTLNKSFIYNLVYGREGLHLFGKFVVNYLGVRRFYLDILENQTLSKCSKFVKAVIRSKESLKELENWSKIRNDYLSWTSEYPFLKNIHTVLDLPFDTNFISFVQARVRSECSVRYAWHTVMYLERTLRTVIQDLQDITVLIALMDQKAFVRIQSMPVKFRALEPNILSYLPEFGFSICYKCRFYLQPNAVYNVNRFRYLNTLKSTITLKHIAKHRGIGPFYLSKNKSIHCQLNKKTEFMYKMMHSAKKRQKWMSRHFKSEITKLAAEESEEKKMYHIRVPLL